MQTNIYRYGSVRLASTPTVICVSVSTVHAFSIRLLCIGALQHEVFINFYLKRRHLLTLAQAFCEVLKKLLLLLLVKRGCSGFFQKIF